MKLFAKRVTTVVVMLALAIGMGFALGACGGSASNDKDEITKGLSEVLDNFKNPTAESLSEYIDDASISQLESYGVDYVELFQHLFKHFDYTINDVQIDGDKAVVKLTVENADITKAMNDTVAALENDSAFISEAASAYQSGGEKAVYSLVFAKVYEAIDASTDIVKSDAELTCTKVNGEWTPDEDSMTELVSKIYGGMDMSSL